MLNDAGETAIERHQDTPLAGGRCKQLVVGGTCELLITGEGDVVPGFSKNHPDRVGNVLIELDRWHDYAAGMGTIVSRASSAAYARAAGIASFGSVG